MNYPIASHDIGIHNLCIPIQRNPSGQVHRYSRTICGRYVSSRQFGRQHRLHHHMVEQDASQRILVFRQQKIRYRPLWQSRKRGICRRKHRLGHLIVDHPHEIRCSSRCQQRVENSSRLSHFHNRRLRFLPSCLHPGNRCKRRYYRQTQTSFHYHRIHKPSYY